LFQEIDHFDLLLETNASRLLAWRIPEIPHGILGDPNQGACSQYMVESVAERIQDHRVKYLDYEGPLSDDRGSVTQCLSGKYLCYARSPLNNAESCCTANDNRSIGPLSLKLVEDLASSPQAMALSFVLASHQNQWLLAVPITPVGSTTPFSLCSVGLFNGL